MPLVRRDDSLLVVVDAQPGFFAPSDTLGEEDARRAAAAVTRIAWMAGLAGLLGIPAVAVEEGPERNGATDPGILERLPASPRPPRSARRPGATSPQARGVTSS